VQVADQREGDLPGPSLGLDRVGEDHQFIHLGFPSISEVEFVLLICEVVVLILDQHSFLIDDKVVGLLHHEIGHREILGYFSHFVSEIYNHDEEGDHEEVGAQYREDLQGRGSQIPIDGHIVDSQHEDRQEKDIHQTVEVFLPEYLLQERLRPLLHLLCRCFLAQYAYDDQDYDQHQEDEVDRTHHSEKSCVLHQRVNIVVVVVFVVGWGLEGALEEVGQEGEGRSETAPDSVEQIWRVGHIDEDAYDYELHEVVHRHPD
jgi:hypothetical protein